jgi:hypothetical protein
MNTTHTPTSSNSFVLPYLLYLYISTTISIYYSLVLDFPRNILYYIANQLKDNNDSSEIKSKFKHQIPMFPFDRLTDLRLSMTSLLLVFIF